MVPIKTANELILIYTALVNYAKVEEVDSGTSFSLKNPSRNSIALTEIKIFDVQKLCAYFPKDENENKNKLCNSQYP